jgi:hypothetical protein
MPSVTDDFASNAGAINSRGPYCYLGAIGGQKHSLEDDLFSRLRRKTVNFHDHSGFDPVLLRAAFYDSIHGCEPPQ